MSYRRSNQVSSTSSTSGGVGVVGLLGVAFVVLKLVGVIDWSWWWVTLPFWGPTALGIAIGVTILIVWAVLKGFKLLSR